MRPHEECKDTYKGPVCNCKHGYKRKHGHCVGKKITDKHTHTFKWIKHSILGGTSAQVIATIIYIIIIMSFIQTA
jgi:hypothetical protein